MAKRTDDLWLLVQWHEDTDADGERTWTGPSSLDWMLSRLHGTRASLVLGVGARGDQAVAEARIGATDSIEARLLAAADLRTFAMRADRYRHDRWGEQREHGGHYFAAVSASEYRRLWLDAYRTYLHERQRAALEAAEYVKPEPLPYDALPEPAKRKILVYANGCWVWQGQRNSANYGIFRDHEMPNDRAFAHCRIYELLCGAYPENLILRHFVCDNPPCVNPHHLQPGTHHENALDTLAAGHHPWSNGGGASEYLRAKLSDQDVRQIRHAAALGETQREIARRYSLQRNTVDAIVMRRIFTGISD